jgi:hypothetical protein
MKKMLVACALALAVTAASQQSASAWHDIRFSAGVNFCCKGGGNSLVWNWSGGIVGAPYPGCGFDGGFDHGYAVGPMFQNYQGYAYNGAAPTWQAPAPSPVPQAPATAGNAAQQTYSPYYNTGYQPVGYSYPGYSQYQVPAYWYGR